MLLGAGIASYKAATPVTPPSLRPVNLVQAGDSKTPCIYAGVGTNLRQAESATGLKYDCIETFSNADRTWADWVRPWVTKAPYGYRAWLAHDHTGRTIILTQNLIPDSESTNPDWRAEGAAGDFNKYARSLARVLVNAGFGYSVIRLGSEMNGVWANDTIGDNKTQWRQWARYFAQIVMSMRSVKGAHFLFDWNVNAAVRPIPPSYYYPGNAYVDIVGIDFYDVGPNAPPVSSPRRWTVLSHERLGLDAVYAFASRRGKPLSIPEWGTVDPQNTGAGFNATGGGDDGTYVAHMGDFIASHNVAYQSWFDNGDDGVYELLTTDAPKSVAAYVNTISRRQRRH